MVKKSTTRNSQKESHSKEPHTRKPDSAKGSGSAVKNWQADQEISMAKGKKSQGQDWMAERGKTNQGQGIPDFSEIKGAPWIPEASKSGKDAWSPEIGKTDTGCWTKLKNGCFPKAAILILTLITAGAFLLLRS